MPQDASPPIALTLSADDALVLFELLSRWTDDDGDKPAAACFDSPAEPAALVSLLAVLEAQLEAPFAPNYEALVAAARKRIVAVGGEDFTL